MSMEPDQRRLDDIGDVLVDAIGRSQRRDRRLHRASLVATAAAVLAIGWLGLASVADRSGTDAAGSPTVDAVDPNPVPAPSSTDDPAGTGEPTSPTTPTDQMATSPESAHEDSTSGPVDRPSSSATSTPASSVATSANQASSSVLPSSPPTTSSPSASISTSTSSSSTLLDQPVCEAVDPVGYTIRADPVVDGGPRITDWAGVALTGIGVDGNPANLVEDRLGVGVEGGRWATALDLGSQPSDRSERIELRFARPQCSIDLTLRRLSERSPDRPGDVALLQAVAEDGTVVATMRASRTQSLRADETFTLTADRPFRMLRVSAEAEVGGFWVSGVAFDRAGVAES